MKHNIFKTLTVLGMFLFAMGAWADPTVNIKKQLNGVDTETGTVTSSISNGVCTLTVTPASGNYVTVDYITAYSSVTGNLAQGRTRDPGLDNIPIVVTASTPDADPSGETKYTFNMPGGIYNVDVTVNFQGRTQLTLEMVSNIEAQTYTGEELTPAVTVTYNGNVLTEDTHYTVEYSDNVNAGTNTAKATITGKGIYITNSGEATSIVKTFTINPKSIETATVTADATQTYTYTGSAITPNTTVSILLKEGAVAATELTEETDYTITYDNNTNAATADSENAPTITVTGTGNFTGTATGKFTIGQVDFTQVNIEVIDDQLFTGSPLTPAVTVTFNNTNGKITVAASDYNAEYSNNTQVGTATVTLTSTGKNFATGQTNATFVINPTAPVISPDPAGSPYYAGKQVTITADEAIENAEIKYILGNDLNVAASTYNAPITLTQDTTVTAWVEVTVGDNTYSSDRVTANYTVKPQETGYLSIMDGSAYLSQLRVTNGNTFDIKANYQLHYPEDIAEEDFTWTSDDDNVVSVNENGVITAVGYGRAEIAFAYEGDEKYAEYRYTFYVDATPESPTISLPAGAYLEGQAPITITKTENNNNFFIIYTWDYLVDDNDGTWKNYSDDGVVFQEGTLSAKVGYTYQDTYNNNTNRTIYSDIVSVTYTELKNIASCTVAGNEGATYTGADLTPTLTVTPAGGGAALTAGTDYTVSYKKGETAVNAPLTDAATYTIVITAEEGSEYGGSKEVSFTIAQADLNDVVIGAIDDQAFTGSQIKPETVTVTLNGNAVSTDDYTIGYGENINAGTNAGSVTLTSKGKNFLMTNTKTANFTITPKTLTEDMVTLSAAVFYYNGTNQKPEVTVADAGIITASDYDITNEGGTAAGTYDVVVTAKRNYTGEITKQFTINNRMATAEMLGLSDNQTYGTYFTNTEDLSLPDGIVAYVITGVSGTTVTTKRMSYIPKGVAVLLKQGTSTEDAADEAPNNMLQGTTAATDVSTITGGTVYLLFKGEFVKTVSGTIPANRCYLVVPGASGARSLSISHSDDETTGIQELRIENEELREEWYDLQGRRINKPTKAGLYIWNGKKVYKK